MAQYNLPQSIQFEGRDVPLYTFAQLQQQPRPKLKSRAMDLRDLVGEQRLPALIVGGSVESVTMWCAPCCFTGGPSRT